MSSDHQGQSLHGLVKACAVTALLSQIAPSSQAQPAEATAEPPKAKTDPLEKYLNPGPFRIRPHAAVAAFYDSNILLRETDEEDDFVWALSPGVLVGVGEYLDSSGTYAVVDYTPTIYLFTKNSGNNGVNQDVNFLSQWKGAKLTLGLGQSYFASMGGLLDVTNRFDRELAGEELDQQSYVTTLRGAYQFSDKTAFELAGRQIVRTFGGDFNDYNEWLVAAWFNYQATPKLQTGAGVTVGWRDIEASPNEMYEQALVRVSYQVAAKVDAVLSGGIEWDQYQDGFDRGPFFVFSAQLNYQPWERTLISLDAHRRDQNSIYASSQSYTITGFRVVVQQKILDKLTGSLSGGYDFSDYHATGTGVPSGREDNFYYVGAGLNYNITARWDAGVFGVYRKNDSNEAGFSYEDYQVGVRSSYHF
jgi:hypothetical protein